MKSVWIAILAIAASPSALAQSTIYKHVDDSGRITYSNKPMKGATVLELEPLTTITVVPAGAMAKVSASADKESREPAKAESRPAVATVTPVGNAKPTLASVEPQLQRRRDEDRRRILEQELKQEEESLEASRGALIQEQQNPVLIAAVRVAQQAPDPTPAQMAEMRANIDKASGRIRGLQSTVAEHEKNIEALKKELGAIKP
jgi:exonuclease VII large subunit